ncbi:MAG: beta-galactosidase, partial [Bacteroidaceae bacterium]|nr:beta-galactosidase [Bacteroidaceae bacterium]
MAVSALGVSAQRKETVLGSGWKFTRSVQAEGKSPAAVEFDDRKWSTVTVPHDWAISGPFDREIDKQTVAIVQNGEKEATEKTGRSGSLPWIGEGWYRTTFKVEKGCERAVLNFDGAMAEPDVYVNGEKAGGWKYGYNAFNVDVTPYINKDGGDNVLAVHLRNLEESSRWYPGAGLYRPVTLVQTGKVAFDQWGIEANTLRIDHNGKIAVEELKAKVVGRDSQDYEVEFTIDLERGLNASLKAWVDADGVASGIVDVNSVTLWTPETPRLYTLTASLYRKGDGNKRVLCDRKVQKVGFRMVSCSAEGGFQLNGQTRKIKGVCLHHDLGMLGSAVNKAAIVRQISLLKTMGCDAIRTAHNMPSQMQMDVCDSLGMMVMAESFDMWLYPKCKNGYARFFNEWSDRDIENLVKANRLHPSIVMWSVGNEIPEQGMKNGAKLLRHLQDVVRRYDVTRPITNGMDRIDNAMSTGFAQVADVPGLNYRTHRYQAAYEGLGQGYVLGSETASTVSSRGVYKFPVKRF